MINVVARGLLREAKRLMDSGVDTDTALTKATKGASVEVRREVMMLILHYHQKGQEPSADTVRQAIYNAVGDQS